MKNENRSDNVLSAVLKGICEEVGLPMCLTLCVICVVLGTTAFFHLMESQGSDWCCVNLKLK